MVKLRLKRMGSKFSAFYRIVAADQRAPRDGRFIEEVGYYNPHTKEVRINEIVREKWLNEGAVPSDTVKKLFAKYEVAKAAGHVSKDSVVTLIQKPKKVKKAEEVVIEVDKVEEVKVETKEA